MPGEIYQTGELTINVESTKYTIKVTWLGNCTLKNPGEFLDPILLKEYEKSQKELKRLIFDFTKFKFMNSSAIIPIIKILKTVKNHHGSIHVLYNSEERWQNILLGELKIFETEDSRVKILPQKPL
jgi:hypothetical protein